jgi:hypothetical protein
MPLETWVKWAQFVGTASAAMTVLALIVVGWFGLTRYAKDKRLKAADLLLKMEEEHRKIQKACWQFDDLSTYDNELKPALELEAARQMTDDDAKTIRGLDRCLRFFYICTVLADMKVEEAVLAPAYYYYLTILADPVKPEKRDQRKELRAYLKKYYPRLDTWIRSHKRTLDAFTPSDPGARG